MITLQTGICDVQLEASFYMFFCTTEMRQHWGLSAECLSEPGALLRHNVLLDLGSQLWLYHNASFSGIPIANAKCLFFPSGDAANLDPVNNIKKEADVTSVCMLLSKTEAAIISVRTAKTLSWRLCISNIKMSKILIRFINMSISLASQCFCINGADTLETPPNVS